MSPLIPLLFLALAGGGRKKKKKKAFLPGPLVVGTFKVPKPVVPPVFHGDWAFVGDFRPTPGEYGEVNSKWCLPSFAGGGCRTVPIKLGFPANWVDAEALQVNLVQSPEPLSVDMQIEAFARTKATGAALAGDPDAFTELACVRWRYTGTASNGLIPMVKVDQNPMGMSGKDLERCAFALDPNPPEVRVLKTENIYRLVLTVPPGAGSLALFRIVASWTYV